MYKFLLRPLLFSLTHGDPEKAHELTLTQLSAVSHVSWILWLLRKCYVVENFELERTVFGLRFPNPVGLAAGMDKHAMAIPAWAAFGLGFVEVGTVTWHAQPGNPPPRMFRLTEDKALINRMGFNNYGAAAMTERLRTLRTRPIPIGISLGKSRITPLEMAIDDYCSSFRVLYNYGDYFAINISSPNTPGLRTLQDRDHLDELLAALQRENQAQSGENGIKPLLVKISPDLSESALSEILDVCADHGISGIIATNTTTNRDGLNATSPRISNETGGLSGRPLTEIVCKIVRFIHTETQGRLPIIGVGGIFGPDDALRMFDAGASLLQIYTGLVYEGPELVRKINQRLIAVQTEAEALV